MNVPIPVSEIFGPTIEGEGDLIGQPTVFLRTGGCDFRCSWCDTMYAVDPKHRGEWKEMTPIDIMQEIERLSPEPILVTISGGNPALRDGIADVIEIGHNFGYTFTMETQGSIYKDWFNDLDYLTISPKPPSAGQPTDLDKVEQCIEIPGDVQRSLKCVVFDDDDYSFARDVHRRFPWTPFYLSVGNETANTDPDDRRSCRECLRYFPEDDPRTAVLTKLKWLMEKVAVDPAMRDTRVLPQLHVLAWGNERGV